MENRWRDIHTRLMGYIRDQLCEILPLDLSVRAEEREWPAVERDRECRADVRVTEIAEAWKQGLPPVWQPENGEVLPVAEPEVVIADHDTDRWIEIRDCDEKLITAIEVLSPANKLESGRSSYAKKQAHFLASDASFVEIDLLRCGRHTVAVDPQSLKPKEGTQYIVCVTRGYLGWQREVYRCGLREPLPTVRIPLRPGDMDVPLAIQAMIDRCYRTGRYWQMDHDPQTLTPKLPDDEAKWVAEMVNQAGSGT